LVVSLANTQEPLYLINWSGIRRSAEGAAERFDQAAALRRAAGFRRITFRGNTDLTQTRQLDRWDTCGVRFVFGYDTRANLIDAADGCPCARGGGWFGAPPRSADRAAGAADERERGPHCGP
jgi:hypothetical protein